MNSLELYNQYYSRWNIEKPSDLREVQLELTAMCNADCPFCINRASFAEFGRKTNGLDTETWIKVIDWIVDSGIKRIRFTGGEPMLRKDLFTLAKYAKAKGVFTVLNTNGFHVSENQENIIKYFDVVLLSIISSDSKITDEVMNSKNSHLAKLNALKSLQGHDNIWVDTVINERLVVEFDNILHLLKEFNVKYWFLLREEPHGGIASRNKALSIATLSLLIAKIQTYYERELGSISIGIGNAVPVCSTKDTRTLMELIHKSDGGHSSEGRSKLVINPYGEILVDRGINISIGKIFDPLEGVIMGKFSRMIRGIEVMPDICRICPILLVCHGGSRMAAHAMYGDFSKPDPWMNPNNLNPSSFKVETN